MDKRYDPKNYGKALGNYSAAMIVDAIIDDICGRSGGDHWFEPIDEETKDEIRDTWAKLIQGVRHPEDAKRPSYAELTGSSRDNVRPEDK